MATDPQAQAILDDLRDFETLFDLELPRAGGPLGERLLDLAVEGIIGTIMLQEDPDGVPWAPLSPGYERWKSAHSPGNPISYLYGLMDDPQQIEGVRAVSADLASMTYGTSSQARDEAEWFQEGDANRPPRVFYALTADAIRKCDALLDRHFNDAVKP